MRRKIAILAVGLALMTWATGCRVRTEKDANGEEKTVQVDTRLAASTSIRTKSRPPILGCRLPRRRGSERRR